MTHKNFQNKMQLLLGALLSLGAALSPTAARRGAALDAAAFEVRIFPPVFFVP